MAQRKYFRIPDLSGGLNPDQGPTQIAENEATEIRNFRLDKVGSLLSRRGYSRYLDMAAGSDIVAIGRWRDAENPSDAKVLVARANGTLASLGAAYTSLITGLASTGGEFTAVGQRVLYANGTDLPVLCNGSTAWHVGLAAPQLLVANEVVAATTLDAGAYRYAITQYDSVSRVESNPCATVTANPNGSEIVRLLLPAHAARADKWRIYRTDKDGAALMFLAEEAIAAIQWEDNGSSTPNPFLPLQYDNTVPLPYEHVAYVKGYVFGSVGNRLYWSKPLQPEYWPGLNYTTVPFEGNDTIRALWAHQDTLVIFGRKNLILVTGTGGNWNLARADIETGAVSPHAIAEVDGILAYLDYEGLRSFPGPQRIAPKLDRIFAALPLTTIEQAGLVYVPEERSLWITLPAGTYTVHLPTGAIGWYSLLMPRALPGGEDGFSLPVFVDSGLRYVNQYGTALDLGGSIPIMWRSKVFQLDNPETVKFFRRLGAFASAGAASTVTVTIADAHTSYTIALAGTGGGASFFWDVGLWDSSRWSGEELSYFIGALPSQTLRGHAVQVTISGDVTQLTEIVGPITFEYRESNRFLGQ
jgi:hypothetical protein